jgi:MoxR-like ATPase
LSIEQIIFKNMSTGINAINEAVKEASAFTHPLFNELGKVIVGQSYLTERLVIGLLANGHVLLEGVPGLAKTLAVKSMAACISVKFSRLQFTPDMLPADVIGTQIYSPAAFPRAKGRCSPISCWLMK